MGFRQAFLYFGDMSALRFYVQCKSCNRCTASIFCLLLLPQFYIRKFPFDTNAESLCSIFAFFELLSWHENALGF